jgi:hypothetical protein
MFIILLELNNLHLKNFSSFLRRSTPNGIVRGEVVNYDTAQWRQKRDGVIHKIVGLIVLDLL